MSTSRIVIDARLYGLENGGLGRYIINLIDEYKKQDTSNTYILILREKYFGNLKIPKNWEKTKVDYRHYSIREQTHLPKLIKSLNPDLVHFPHFNVPIFYSGKFIVTIHDILMHNIKGKEATTLPKHMYFLKRFGYKTVFKRAVNKSREIIVPSNTAKQDLINYYKIESVKVKVIYEGVDKNVLRISDKSRILNKYKLDAPYFLYVGNAYPHKNLNRAIEAILFLNNRSKTKTLLAISTPKNAFSKRLKDQIKKLHAEKFAINMGFVPDSEIGTLHRNAIGFVYPSLIEGFGLQGLEAIANGNLLLASDIPVFKEVYGDNVMYFNPFDFSSIERTMYDALNLKISERSKRIIKAKKFITRYSWQKTAKQTLEVYNSVLK